MSKCHYLGILCVYNTVMVPKYYFLHNIIAENHWIFSNDYLLTIVISVITNYYYVPSVFIQAYSAKHYCTTFMIK